MAKEKTEANTGKKSITMALAGNPNVGKSTVFNGLTGAKQHVGNWPGKTVERKDGKTTFKGREVNVVDLPGTYSLTAYSIEETITRDYIMLEKPDVVVHVVDSLNLERNLYLTIQLMEMEANVIVALNMTGLARSRGIEIDADKISSLLRVPVVKIEASKHAGLESLMEEVLKAADLKKDRPPVRYGKELDSHIDDIESMIRAEVKLPDGYPARWVATKLLENDQIITGMVSGIENGQNLDVKAGKDREHLKDIYGDDVDEIFADERYGLISGLVRNSVKKNTFKKYITTDIIDNIVTNRILGIPIFLLMMWLTFYLTFTVATPFSDLIDMVFADILAPGVSELLAGIGAPGFVTSFIVDAAIGGVGSVLVFVPQIFILFLVIAILEDSGYMARAAFVMDKLMSKLGLHGKSFLPMILGFGCSVPAIMAARTLENEKDRIMTILIAPFMSCGARLPVYVLFAAAFFPQNADLVVFSLYILGIVVAILMGLMMRNTMFKGALSPFLMELPPYRVPTIKGTLTHMWERGVLFIKKAGTMIFLIVIVVWVLASFPPGVEYASQDSLIGVVGTIVSPVFEPLGFGNWQSSVYTLQ